MDTRIDLRTEISNRAWRDEAFRTALKQNPKSAIERAFGVLVPNAVVIELHEESDSVVHIVLPSRSAVEAVDRMATITAPIDTTFSASAPTHPATSNQGCCSGTFQGC